MKGTLVAGEAQGRNRDWLVALLLLGTMVFSFVDRFGLSVLIDPLKRDLGITDARIGLLHGVPFGIFYALMGMPFGWLADRWSRTGTIALGVAIWSAATMGSAFASSFSMLLLARIWVGAGEAALAPAAYGIIHSRFPAHLLGRAMSVFQVGALAGAGLAVMIAGFVLARFEGGANLPLATGFAPWQQTFLVLGLPGFAIVPLILMIRDRRERPAPADVPTSDGLVAALRANRGFYTVAFLAMACLNMTTYASLSWMPAVMHREFGLTPDRIGVIFGSLILCVCPIGLLLGGWLADWRASPERPASYLAVPMLAGCIALPSLGFVAIASSLTGLMIALGALHLALSMPIGSIPAFLQIITPASARGRVSALYVLVVNIVGLGLSPTLVGYFSTRSSDDPAGLRAAVIAATVPALGVAILLVGGAVLLARRRERRIPSVKAAVRQP